MKVNQIFISSEKRSGGTKELMTLRWTETDVDTGRVNFTCGETERGRSDLSRSRFAIDFPLSRFPLAHVLYNRDFLRYGISRFAQEIPPIDGKYL